jgi:hypothetical protein
MVRAARLALLTPLLVATQAAQPDRWVYVATTDRGTEWYVDSSRFQIDGRLRTAWFRLDHQNDRTTSYRQTMYRMEIDCAAMRWRLLSATEYRPDGTSNSPDVYTSTGSDIVPDSAMELAARVTCAVQDPPRTAQ